MATSFNGGGSHSERTTDPGQATGKVCHLRLRVECTIFCNLPSLAWTHAVLVIGLYELLGIPTTYLIEPNGPLKCDLLFGFHELNTSIVKYYII